MTKLKEFPEEKKLDILTQVLATGDIREILNEGLHRRHILGISTWGLSEGMISEDQFNAIVGKIERPRKFPTDPEQRLEALLSVGNTEPKQVLSLLLSDEPQSVEALRNQFISLIEGVQYRGRQWRPYADTIEAYLWMSLDQIGFIAFPVIGTNNIGYKRTQAGRTYGQPVMAFMLHTSNQIGMSMYQLLGSTSTSGDSRAPYNRFRILEFLLDRYKHGKNTREVDIINLLNLRTTSIGAHLNALKKIGFVEWDSVNTQLTGQFAYRWKEGKNPDQVSTIKGLKTLTQEVSQYLYQNKRATCIDIAKTLVTKETYQRWRYRNLIGVVSNILSRLEQDGFAEVEYKSGMVQSHVNIIRNRAEFINEFTRKLRGAADGNAELTAMEQIYDSYMADKDRFQGDSRRAVGFYVGVSSVLNQFIPEEATRRILKYLSQKGKSRPSEMKKDLGFDVIRHLGNMSTIGLVTKIREGGKSFYSLNPNYRSS